MHRILLLAFAGLLFSTTLSGQTGKNYISDDEKGLTKEIVISRLGQPDKYTTQGGDDFENRRQECFYYGEECIKLINGDLVDIDIDSPKCRMLTWLIKGGITVGDNISNLLNSLGDIKYTKKEIDSKPGCFIYNILLDDLFHCYTDSNGTIYSMYYIELGMCAH